MYQALYRACRPETFSEMLGQEHVVKILSHQLKTDSVSHAYLFCGTRGTGKTTTARLLAKGLNCLSPNADGTPCGKCSNCESIKDGTFIDVIEIDAASNNGVDNIRELRESVNYPPQIGRKKVYIIDEVHMLSTGAFNALLKTLEEPPKDVIFILATTEPEKLPKTILSRCMRLDFKRVPEKFIFEGMKKICEERGVNISDSALRLVSNAADGSVRDGFSILDQVLSSGEKELDRDKVLEYIGAVSQDFYIDLTELVSIKKTEDAILLLDEALKQGKEVKQIERDWLSHYRNLLLSKFMKSPEDLLNMSTENINRLREQANHITVSEISDAIFKLSKTINDSRYSTQSRVLLELAIIEISSGKEEHQVTKRVEVSKPVVSLPQDEKKKVVKETKKEIHNTENTELDTFWDEIMEIGEDTNGTLNIVRKGTKLKRIDELTFLVYANNSFNKIMAEQRKDIIENIVTNRLGRPMRMIVEINEETVDNSSENKEIADKLMSSLGLEVEVE